MAECKAGRKNSRKMQAEETKDRLFSAAVSLLSEKDFEQITIRDIVSRANVSIGTFYNYYTTKMEVFYETYRVADHYFDSTVASMLVQPTAYERILSFFEFYAHYSSDLTDMKMTKLLYNTSNPFFNRDPRQGMVGLLIRLIRGGQSAGELSSSDSAEEIAEYLMISIRGLVYNWCTRERSYELAPAIRRFVSRLLCAYRPSCSDRAFPDLPD